MTMRRVSIALTQISRRNHNAFAMQAAIWGAEIPLIPSAAESAIAIAPISDDQMNSLYRDAARRKQSEMRPNG